MNVNLGDDQKVRIRLIDCVGFLVKDASGHIEDGRERMVKTPWLKSDSFHEAAETGTRKSFRNMQRSDWWLRQMEASANFQEKISLMQRH